MHNFRKIKAWEEAMDLAMMVYEQTKSFPESEKFGLVTQLRRCAVSIVSNIAEGAGRDSKPQFVHFLSIASASGNELLAQLILSNRLNFITDTEFKLLEDKTDKLQRMLTKFKNQL
ncbi:MAG: four helix bundle protein [Chitinophagales bacterium]